MDTYLIKLNSHLSNDLCMLHGGIHVRGDATTTPRAVDEELDEIKQCRVSVSLVCFNPLVNNRLQNNEEYIVITEASLGLLISSSLLSLNLGLVPIK